MTLPDIQLPASPMTEAKLLSSLLIMLPKDRDAAVKHISYVWFADLWNRRLFEQLCVNRRRDLDMRFVKEMKSKDGPLDNSSWWIARLLVDRDNSSASGNPFLWREYAHVLEKLYSYRVRILLKLEELKELIDVSKSETYPLCDPSERNEGADDGNEG